MSIAQELTPQKTIKLSMTGAKPAHPGMIFKHRYVDGMGLNISQISKSLDAPRPVMSRIFSGEKRLSITVAEKFAEYTGETILYWYQMQINRDVWEYERKIL